MVLHGMKLTRTIAKNNILKVLNSDSQFGLLDWYTDAHEECTELWTLSPLYLCQIVGVVAALSPMKSWSQNIIQARKMILTGDCGHMKSMKSKAERIMKLDRDMSYEEMKTAISDILNGNKIVSFFHNILEPNETNVVTIDRHAISIAIGRKATDKEQQLTRNQYEFLAQCYQYTAEGLGMTASKLQGITWSNYRGTNK